MASGASAAFAVAVLAIMVLSSQGDQETGSLCSDNCVRMCTAKCADQIFSTCSTYCANPLADRQDCEKQVFKECTVSFCCNNNCSRDCRLEATNACQWVHDNTSDCKSCRDDILQCCPPTCYNDCNNTCVKK